MYCEGIREIFAKPPSQFLAGFVSTFYLYTGSGLVIYQNVNRFDLKNKYKLRSIESLYWVQEGLYQALRSLLCKSIQSLFVS